MSQHEAIEQRLKPFLEKGLELWLEAGALRFKGPKELLNKDLMALLKANKPAIMSWLEDGDNAGEAAPPQVIDEYPLAYTQGAIWMLYKFAPNSPAYNTTFACTLEDDVDEQAVKKAFQALLIRHPVLRSTFYDSDQGPRQQVWDRIDMPLALVDGSQWNEVELQEYLNSEADAPFDLGVSSCLRVKIVRNSVKGTVLIATIQHVGADLWALLLVAEDIKTFYEQALAGDALSVKPVATSYRQHVEWQQQFMESVAGKAERRYWHQQLMGAPTQISLPEDFPRPPVLQLQADVVQQRIGGERYQQIKQFCKSHSITPFILFQGLFQQLIGKINQQDDFLVGTPTMGRSRKGMDKVVGDFANPVVLRAQLSDVQQVGEFFQGVRTTLLSAMEHQECPFPVVVQDCNPPRDSSRTPLFQLMFVWHQGNADLFPKDGFIKSVLPMSGPRGAPYDVMLAVGDMGDHYELNWTYQISLYRPQTVTYFSVLLRAILERVLQMDWLALVADIWSHLDAATDIQPVAAAQINPLAQRWLQAAGLDPLASHATVAVVDTTDKPVTQQMPGMLRYQTPNSALTTPIIARQNNTQLSCLGLQVGWGVLDGQLVDWREKLFRLSPEFNSYNSLVLTQVTGTNQWVQRLFTVDATLLVERHRVSLDEWFQDVIELEQWPLDAAGKVKLSVLRQLAWLDRPTLLKQLKQYGLTARQLVTWRKQTLLPSLTYNQNTKNASTTERQKTDLVAVLEQREAAWIKGEPLADTAIESEHLFDALKLTAQRWPEKGILFIDAQGQEQQYTYPQLVEDALKVAHGLAQMDFDANGILLLQMRFDARFFALWWGAVALGVRPLVVATPEKYHEKNGVAQKLYNVAHNYSDLVVAADHERVGATREWLGADKPVFDVDDLLNTVSSIDLVTADSFTPLTNENGVAFLQLTSGSTGTPKAIQIRHQGILHHVAASAEYNGYSINNVSLNWLPFDHVVPILTTHLKDVVLGIQQIQLPTAAVLMDPLLWLRKLSDFKVTHSWAPNFAFQRVLDALKNYPDDLSGLNLASVQFLMNAGEQVLTPTVKAFTAALTPYGLANHVVQPAFGMAEACTCMTYNNQSTDQLAVSLVHLTADVIDVVAPDTASHHFVDLGGVVPGVEVRITDHNNQVVKAGVIGRMQIRGPVITPGYLNNPEANAEAFVGDDWFNSGDLGFIWQQHLVLTGREKEMIVVNGVNYYCFEMEQMVGDLPGVLPTFVAATGVNLGQGSNSDELVMFYVPDQSVELVALERHIKAQVTESFGVNVHAVIPVDKESFYKTTSGKIQRGQFKKLFENDFYADELDAYQQRHQEQELSLDTLYRLEWFTKPSRHLDSAASFSLDDADALLDYLQTSTASHLVVELGHFEESDSGNSESLLSIALKLGQLAKLIIDAGYKKGLLLRLYSATQETGLVIKPLVETLRQETGNAQISCVMLSPEVTRKGDTEISLEGHEVLAWSDGANTLQPRLRNLKPWEMNAKSPLKPGAYLITGGLGGLAEPLIEFLLGQGIKHLLVSGRGELDNNPRRQSRFNQLQAKLTSQGIAYVNLSQWDSQSIDAAVQHGLQAVGADKLGGIFHLAGHLEMQSLATIDTEHWQQVLEAKLTGGQQLASYLEAHWPGSVLVQYGSVNGFFGGANAGAYSVACATQAQLTEQLNRRALISAWNFNWSLWQGAGMAAQFSYADVQMARNKGFVPIPLTHSNILLATLMRCAPGNYYAGLDSESRELLPQLNLYYWSQQAIQVYIEGTPELDREAVKNLVGGAFRNPSHCIQDPQFSVYVTDEAFVRNDSDQIQLALLQQAAHSQMAEMAPSSATEQAIADIWSQVLGKPVNDVARTFFEYGGHSINATQVVAAINQQLGLQLTVANLFQYPSVAGLAALAEGDQAVPEDWLSLSLPDFIQRADHYRLDPVNPALKSGRSVVFLPTALGIASAYGPMIATLSNHKSWVMSMPVGETERAGIQEAAKQGARLLTEANLVHPETVLVGWSIAGVLGYEILRLLAAEKRSLPALVMLDSGFNEGLHEITWNVDFQVLMFAVELGLGVEKFAEFNQLADQYTKLHWLQQYLATIGIEVTDENLIEWWRAYEERMKSLLNYQVSELLKDAKINLLKAELHTHGRSDLGWPDNNNNISWSSIQADHQGIVNHSETLQWMTLYLQ